MAAEVFFLAKRPVGIPTTDCFESRVENLGAPGPGEALVEIRYISIDPALRPRMNAESAYAGALELGEPIPSAALGIVLECDDPDFPKGTAVFGRFGWRTRVLAPTSSLRKIAPERAPFPKWLSVLGLSSFTAWYGITRIARPVKGETLVVTGAAGATGSMAGQIGRILGAKVVGIAGGDEKCRRMVEDFRFDGCVNYRTPDFQRHLSEACPDGVDVAFENVGGDIMKSVFERMREDGRMVICGLISEYNGEFNPGPNFWPFVYKSLRVEGFRASKHWALVPQFIEEALGWYDEGKLDQPEFITRGFSNAPQAFIDMLSGKNIGKSMVEVG